MNAEAEVLPEPMVDAEAFYRPPPAEGRRLTDYERGFLEAFIEGEGCIYFGIRQEREKLNSSTRE